jgi:hypothetical protein
MSARSRARDEHFYPLQACRHHGDVWVRHLFEEPQPATGRPASPASIARRSSCLSRFYDYGKSEVPAGARQPPEGRATAHRACGAVSTPSSGRWASSRSVPRVVLDRLDVDVGSLCVWQGAQARGPPQTSCSSLASRISWPACRPPSALRTRSAPPATTCWASPPESRVSCTAPTHVSSAWPSQRLDSRVMRHAFAAWASDHAAASMVRAWGT